ncbi:MAG: hypothetical protein AAGU14_12325 [Eubacteriaceae bacterium]
MGLKKRQQWMIICTLILWGLFAIQYSHIANSIPIQVDANGMTVSAITKNTYLGIVILLTIIAHFYIYKKYRVNKEDIELSFLMPYILFLIFTGSFTFFAIK